MTKSSYGLTMRNCHKLCTLFSTEESFKTKVKHLDIVEAALLKSADKLPEGDPLKDLLCDMSYTVSCITRIVVEDKDPSDLSFRYDDWMDNWLFLDFHPNINDLQ